MLKKNNPGCLCCNQCQWCESGTFPQQFEVVIAGIVNGDGAMPCTDCADLNGTFVFEFLGKFASFGGYAGSDGTEVCVWQYDLTDEAICGEGSGTDEVDGYFLVMSDIGFSLQLWHNVSGIQHEWRTEPVEPRTLDCSEIEDFDIPYQPALAQFGTEFCDGESSTASITAIV